MANVKPLVPASDGFFIQIADADALTLPGGLTSASDITVTGGAELTGLPATPSGITAAVSKAYVTSVLNGLDPKASVRGATADALPDYTASAGPGIGRRLTADDNGALDTGGISDWSAAERLIVKDEGASHVDHGFFAIIQPGDAGTPWILERTTDADENTEVTSGATSWVSEGTHGEQRWTISTTDDITVDTTAITFVQTGGQDLYSAGDGIEISAANVVAVDLAANPGLQFTTGDLDLLLKDATLSKDGSGLFVQGVPSLFTLGGVATSANVTAANLATLTAGTSSDADALHTHDEVTSQNVIKTVTATESIAKGDPVEWSATSGEIQKCRADTAAKVDVIGIALEAIAADATGQILTNGTAVGVLTSATPGDRQFLGDTGGVEEGASSITTDNYLVNIGIAKTATDLEFRVIYLGTA